MEDNKKIQAVEKALGEPFGLQYTEDVLKTRRNLLIAGGIGIFFWWAGLRLESPSSDIQAVSIILGMSVKGVTHEAFLWGLLITTSYLLIHFLWASGDCINEFRLRVTGTRTAYQTGALLGSEDADYPSDPRQSTLYHWWLQRSRTKASIPNSFQEASERINHAASALEELARKHNDPSSKNLNNAIRAAGDINVRLTELKNSIEKMEKLLHSERIPVSLKRFDAAFRWHAISQNARWLTLEFGFPTLIGLLGIASVVAMLR